MFTQYLRRVYAVIHFVTQALRMLRRFTHVTQIYACYAIFTQALRRHYSHYAVITQSLGNLPLSDNYAVLRSHYAELRNRYAVLRSVTQCYAVLHSFTLHYAHGNLLMKIGRILERVIDSLPPRNRDTLSSVFQLQ